MADLDAATQVTQQAIHAVPENCVQLPSLLHYHRVQLSRRYSRTEVMADLEGVIKNIQKLLMQPQGKEAISYYQRALRQSTYLVYHRSNRIREKSASILRNRFGLAANI